MKNSLKVSLEAIDFQSRDFGEELAVIFDNILSSKDDKVIKDNYKAIETITFKRTGIKVKIQGSIIPAAAYIPAMNSQGVMLKKEYRDEFIASDVNQYLNRMKKFKKESFVDLKKARVGGFFSTIENIILLNPNFLRLVKLTAREATAVFLHELGHLFSEFEFISRTVTTNQALACIATSLKRDNNKITEEHVLVVKEVGEIVGDDPNYFQEIFEETNTGSITTMILSKNIIMPLSNMRYDAYDDVTSEAVADLFATRFGFGKELVTSAHKLEVNNLPFISLISAISNIALTILLIKYFNLVLKPLLTLLFSVPNAYFVIFSILYKLGISVIFGGERHLDYTYDKARVRYLRIREQVISALKDQNLSAAEKEYYLDSIKSIDEYIAKTPDDGLVYKLSNYLFKGNRDLKKYNDLQRELEVLASNDIFNKAAELSLMK